MWLLLKDSNPLRTRGLAPEAAICSKLGPSRTE